MKSSEKLYIYPTDTVWGIGAPLMSQTLHKRISQIKRTEPKKPLSLLYTSFSELLFDFDLPFDQTRNENWWKSLFLMETTLALPKKMAKRSIPNWIIYDRPLIAIRLNESEELQQLAAAGPVSTTSLNLHGEPPITQTQEALTFFKKYAPEATFINPSLLRPSGRASTIVRYDEHGDGLEFLREGALIQEVKNHLGV